MYISNAETLKVFPTPNRMLKVFVMNGSNLKLPRETLVVYSMIHANKRAHAHTHTYTHLT